MKPNDKAIKAAVAAIDKYYLRSAHKNHTQKEAMSVALTAAYAAQFQSKDYAGLVKELREDVLQFILKDTVYENIANEAADALEAVLAELKNEREAHKKCVDKRCKLIDEINLLRTEHGALKDLLPNQSHEGRAPIPTDWWSVAVLERRKRRAAEKERDALLARNKRLQETLSYWNDTYKYSPANEQPPILDDAARLAPKDDEELVGIAARAICLVKCALVEWRCKDDGVCKAPVGDFRDPNYVRTVSLGSAWRQSRAAIAAIRPHIEAAERERCAKIAESHKYPMKTIAGTGYNNAAKEIAAAIRSGK